MPPLEWSCADEEVMHQVGVDECKTGITYPLNMENFTWYAGPTGPVTAWTHADLVTSGLEPIHIAGHYANFLSEHTIYTGSGINTAISAYHDKAETIACALSDCQYQHLNGMNLPNPVTFSYFYCKITPDVQYDEKVYEVSNPYIPSQDVICPETRMNTALRQLILNDINNVRRRIQKGLYILKSGGLALKAKLMPKLVWDCDEEAAVFATLNGYGCPIPSDPTTIFQTIIPYAGNTNSNALKASISEALYQRFNQNPSFNFLSSTTIYSAHNPAALVLSDKATKIGCAIKECYDPVSLTANYNFGCRARPSAQINDQLYHI